MIPARPHARGRLLPAAAALAAARRRSTRVQVSRPTRITPHSAGAWPASGIAGRGGGGPGTTAMKATDGHHGRAAGGRAVARLATRSAISPWGSPDRRDFDVGPRSGPHAAGAHRAQAIAVGDGGSERRPRARWGTRAGFKFLESVAGVRAPFAQPSDSAGLRVGLRVGVGPSRDRDGAARAVRPREPRLPPAANAVRWRSFTQSPTCRCKSDFTIVI